MPPYWLSRPGPAPDAATQAEFDALLAAALADGVDAASLAQGRFGPGTVYLLPGGRFEREADSVEDGRTVRTAQAACLEPVQPLAKLAVEPADFPLPIRGHDSAALQVRIEADPGADRPGPVTRRRARRWCAGQAGAGIGAGSMPDRSWPGRALVHTVRS